MDELALRLDQKASATALSKHVATRPADWAMP
jgi:hypothetical protein